MSRIFSKIFIQQKKLLLSGVDREIPRCDRINLSSWVALVEL